MFDDGSGFVVGRLQYKREDQMKHNHDTEWKKVFFYVMGEDVHKRKADPYTAGYINSLMEINSDADPKDMVALATCIYSIPGSRKSLPELEEMIWYWLHQCRQLHNMTGGDPYKGAGALRQIRDLSKVRAYTAEDKEEQFHLNELFELASGLYELARRHGFSPSNPHR